MAEGDRLYAWMTEYPDMTVGLISAIVDIGLGPMNTVLVGRNPHAVTKLFGPVARAHGDATGQRVWLREYTSYIDHEDERAAKH